jgi:hypothetical protein
MSPLTYKETRTVVHFILLLLGVTAGAQTLDKNPGLTALQLVRWVTRTAAAGPAINTLAHAPLSSPLR